jgi:hypothetical protein
VKRAGACQVDVPLRRDWEICEYMERPHPPMEAPEPKIEKLPDPQEGE